MLLPLLPLQPMSSPTHSGFEADRVHLSVPGSDSTVATASSSSLSLSSWRSHGSSAVALLCLHRNASRFDRRLLILYAIITRRALFDATLLGLIIRSVPFIMGVGWGSLLAVSRC